MKEIIGMSVLLFASCTLSWGQIIVNKEDIKEKATMFEVWAFKKPFTNQECYFIDYGQKILSLQIMIY